PAAAGLAFALRFGTFSSIQDRVYAWNRCAWPHMMRGTDTPPYAQPCAAPDMRPAHNCGWKSTNAAPRLSRDGSRGEGVPRNAIGAAHISRKAGSLREPR